VNLLLEYWNRVIDLSLQVILLRIWIKSTSTMPLCPGCKYDLANTATSTD
jgi:hypothetical protein